MRNVLICFLSMGWFVTLSAQFINNGATVTIQSGATLRVETDFLNNGTGTFTNNGTLEVEGNFTNANTATLTAGSGLVKFIGTANSNLDAGGDALHNLELAKTTTNGLLTLSSALPMSGNLNFTGTGNNKLVLGNYNLTLSNSAATVTATTNHTTNGWVVTDKTGANTGSLIKAVASGSSTKNMEIGDDANYSPLSMTVNASSAGTVQARVITNAGTLTTKYADASDLINREWVISGTNITSNTMTGTYVTGDVAGTQSLVKGAAYASGDWKFDGSVGSGNTIGATTTQTNVRLSGMNFFGKANLKAILAGGLVGTATTMSTTLASVIPLTTPYTGSPWSAPSVTATSIPANTTDWILVEVRDAATPATVISQTSAFIKNDGTIVSYDGTALRLKNAVATGHIVLRHRNHLAIRTASALDLVNPPTLKDFTLGTTEAYTNPAITTNANMRLVNSVYAMWGGNANGNANIRYSGPTNDNSALLTALGNNPATVLGSVASPVYNIADMNMNGIVRYAGPSNDNSYLLQNLNSSNANVFTAHQ
jgi:hypothetical protein